MKNKMAGFTMLELMVAVAIVGVLGATSVPSLSRWVDNQRVNSGSLGVRSALMLARSTAIEKNSNVVVVFTKGIGGGFTVFVDDGNLTREAGELVVKQGTMPSGVSVYNTGFSDEKVCYNPMGFPVKAGTVYLKNAKATQYQRVTLAAAGSVKITVGT